ncbi:uncharacterized protein G2W53_024039 [Senna tora]|uniref:Uncharacterized protein n=1 Tax=Senna tora TaxID=362788 RepID=A0A834WIS1_9FABA|nr:uncharacterized protein G2W53_024039 [Senna tora]
MPSTFIPSSGDVGSGQIPARLGDNHARTA